MGKKKQKRGAAIVAVATRQANLKRRVRRHLKLLGFKRSEEDGHLLVEGGGKDVIRALHLAQRNDKLKLNKEFIAQKLSLLRDDVYTAVNARPVPKWLPCWGNVFRAQLFGRN